MSGDGTGSFADFSHDMFLAFARARFECLEMEEEAAGNGQVVTSDLRDPDKPAFPVSMEELDEVLFGFERLQERSADPDSSLSQMEPMLEKRKEHDNQLYKRLPDVPYADPVPYFTTLEDFEEAERRMQARFKEIAAKRSALSQ